MRWGTTSYVKTISLSYTRKGRTLIQVLPAPNAYTKSYCCFLMHVCIMYWNETECVHRHKSVYTFSLILMQNAYMHEQSTIGFRVPIWSRKYLNEGTPFSSVRQWYTSVKQVNCTCVHHPGRIILWLSHSKTIHKGNKSNWCNLTKQLFIQN